MVAALTNLLLFAQETGHAPAEEDSSFLVAPNTGLMIWALIVFGVSMFVLKKVAFPRIQEALDKRQRMIEDSIEHAEITRREADAVLAEYRERLAAARTQADDIVARARKTAEHDVTEGKADGLRRREELLEQARREIETEHDRALRSLRGEVANLTVAATEKVTHRSLSEADQKRLVDEALDELDFAALSGEGK